MEDPQTGHQQERHSATAAPLVKINNLAAGDTFVTGTPKSRKRQPKRVPLGPGKMPVRPLSKTVLGPDGRQSTVAYRPGRLKVDTEQAVWMATKVPPDFAVTYLPLVLLVDHLRGRNANVWLRRSSPTPLVGQV